MQATETDNGYARQRISRAFRMIGIAVAVSAIVVNPWVGSLYRGDIVNYADVMLNYFCFAIICSALIFLSSFFLSKFASKWAERVALLILVMSMIVLSDRLLLARLGLPLWIADRKNHFKHRPNSIRKSQGVIVRINRYGQHDDDFPLEKASSEFRGLMLGDSITMGHGVSRDDTFSAQLENDLRSKDGDKRAFQIIDAGVQGYSTFQEYNVLVDSLKFAPDLIAVQFCLNDLTEPFVVEKRFGGTGVHYQGVAEEPTGIVSFLVNETGYGRVVQEYLNRGKTVENERRWEIYDTKKAAASPINDPTFSESWRVTLSYLDKIYSLAQEKNIRVLLIIAPHTYQMVDERLRQPQQILTEHAHSRGVDVLDLTPIFDQLIFDRKVVTSLQDQGFSETEIEGLYEQRIGKYFLDQDHYTPEGHRVVADQLFKYIIDKYTF